MNLRLKLTQRNYIGYTGVIGRYSFVDGISVEEIPLNERLRIAASFSVVEIDADGNELGNPSPAHLVVNNTRTPAVITSLDRQSVEEKNSENATIVLGSNEKRDLFSHEALEAVVEQSGIAGLRKIAAMWDVRSKSIPVLMQMILDAQKEYIEKQREALTDRGVPAEDIDALLAVSDKPPVKEDEFAKIVTTAPKKVETPAEDVIAKAASVGDLAAAISNLEIDKPE